MNPGEEEEGRGLCCSLGLFPGKPNLSTAQHWSISDHKECVQSQETLICGQHPGSPPPGSKKWHGSVVGAATA